MRRLVLDCEAIAALARGDDRAKGLLKRAAERKDRIVIPAVVVAEATRRHRHLDRINVILKQVIPIPTSERTARLAAQIMDLANLTAVVDAIVVAEAVESDEAVILTCDYDDLSLLASPYQHVRILTV